MSMILIGGMMAGCAGLCYTEKFLSAHILAKYAPALVAPSPMLGVTTHRHKHKTHTHTNTLHVCINNAMMYAYTAS